MVTLVGDDHLAPLYSSSQLGPVCVLTGIGADPVSGRLVHNVPITVGTQTFLHTVCVAPVKEACLLGLDFMTATASVLDLGNETLTIGEDVVPVGVSRAPDYQFSRVSVIRRVVIEPNSVGFVTAELDKLIDGPYIFEGCPSKHTLLSHVYGQGKQITVKVINDSNFFVTFKKEKKLGHAESAVQISPERAYVFQCTNNNSQEKSQKSQEQTDKRVQNLPPHLQQMFLDNISELNDNQKSKFKDLITEFSDVFSKDDFDLGCLNSGVEHKIQTFDEIPINEKFRRTPLQFQKQEQEYIEKLQNQRVIEPSLSEWSAAPVLVRKKTGELRYCIDYRALNAKTYKDNYSLPLIEDCLDSLYGRRVFCVLDHLVSLYRQSPRLLRQAEGFSCLPDTKIEKFAFCWHQSWWPSC